MIRLLTAAMMAIMTATSAPAAIIKFTAEGAIREHHARTISYTHYKYMRVELIYDTSLRDQPTSANRGFYDSALISAAVSIFNGNGTISYTAPDQPSWTDLSIKNDLGNLGNDSLRFISRPFTSFMGANTRFTLILTDEDQTALTSAELPTTELNARDFENRTILMKSSDTGYFGKVNQLSSVTVTDITPAPLPAGAAMLLGGLGLLAMRRRFGHHR